MSARQLASMLAISVAVAIVDFATMLKSFVTNVLKCKDRLKTKFKYTSVAMHFLEMSPFSCDFIKADIDLLIYQQCF